MNQPLFRQRFASVEDRTFGGGFEERFRAWLRARRRGKNPTDVNLLMESIKERDIGRGTALSPFDLHPNDGRAIVSSDD